MKSLWKILAWIFAACGLLANLSAWCELWFGWRLWATTPENLFRESISSGVFAVFFLAWGKWSGRG